MFCILKLISFYLNIEKNVLKHKTIAHSINRADNHICVDMLTSAYKYIIMSSTT